MNKSFNIVPIGGLGEIGMNCLAIETEGKLLLIDCGVMFPTEDLGIELIHPKFDYLAKRRDDIEGIFLTHAHEDHIAGMPYLLRELDIPVYAGSYTSGLLAEKIKDIPGPPKLAAREIEPESKLELGPFTISPFSMPHSIVQNTGLWVEMPAGHLLHTGDFKLGMKGADRGETVLERLRQISNGNIDLMISDSTGSEEDEVAGEESDVERAIEGLVRETSGRVFVAIFSSNIKRLEAIIRVAARQGRKVALCGRSVQNHTKVAAATCGLDIPEATVVSMERAEELPRDESLVIISGTQGEPRAALTRLANDSHHIFSIKKDDLVVLSSRFIPGNEQAIARMIDRLLLRGARVIHRGIMNEIHVSGHGSAQEIRAAIQAVKPRCFLPVHGTLRHLVAGAELARAEGVENIGVATDGEVVRCTAEGISVEEGHFPTGKVYIDKGGGLSDSIIKDRRLLGTHGVLFISFAVDAQGEVTGVIDVDARGVTHEQTLPWLADQIRDKVLEIAPKIALNEATSSNQYRDLIRATIRKTISKLISRDPYVIIIIR